LAKREDSCDADCLDCDAFAHAGRRRIGISGRAVRASEIRIRTPRIAPDDAQSHDLFVHDSGIAGQANGPLVEGAKVSYDTEPTDKGSTAINVEVL